MKWLFLFLLTPLLVQAADEQVAWSQPVKGLRARLFISPSRDPDFDYSYQVYLQFENVGVVGSLGTIREEKTFQYSEMGLALDVTDASGQKLPLKVLGIFDGMIPSWNLCLPWGGNLTFPIGYISGRGKEHLGITPFLAWDLPAAGSGSYFLSGTFSFAIKKWAVPHVPAGMRPPLRDSDIRLNWEGTLVLPPIEVPAR
jgi:hypothetical protein